MHPHIFIIDDFLPFPVKEYVKKIEDPTNSIVDFVGNTNSNLNAQDCHQMIHPYYRELLFKGDLNNETYERLSDVLGSKIEIVDDTVTSSTENTDSPICAHIQSDWIALIYLQLPLSSLGEFGVRFYSHKETGSEFYSEGKELNTLDESQWKEYSKIPAKYNRLVLFKSRLWHSYGNGFGDTLNNSMLYKKIIIRNG